jgi:hypothetical protein
MGSDKTVDTPDFGMVAWDDQAQASETVLQRKPRIGAMIVFFAQPRVLSYSEGAQPRPRHSVGREQTGELKRGSRWHVELRQSHVENEAKFLALRVHLPGDIFIVSRNAVCYGQAPLS